MSAFRFDHVNIGRALRRLALFVGVPVVLASSIFSAYGQDSEATVKKMLSTLALVVA